MANPRKPLSDLMLSGSPNLGRALKREAKDVAVPLDATRQQELAALNELIAQCVKACKKGSTVRRKANPAFGNLATLMKCRELLLKSGPAPKRSAESALKRAAALLTMPTPPTKEANPE